MKKETSAGAVIFYQKEKKREYLLLNYLGGHWDFPKGHVELHENPIQAALREIKEEVGLKVKKISGFERKVTYSFKHRNEVIIKEVIFYLAQAFSQKVVLSSEHKGYVWLPYQSAFELITYNKDILKDAEMFLNKKRKGFTLIEVLIVLSLILILFGITSQIFKPTIFLQRSRDIQRISDLKKLDLALRTYLTAEDLIDLGPANTGIDEASSSIFLSIPFDKENYRNQTLIWNSRTYYFSQVSSTESYKADGQGWLPVDFTILPYPPLFSLPIDPINSRNAKLFYSYVFKRSSSTYEINANLEYPSYRQGGRADKVSNDLGDNNAILEAGNDKNLMPNNLY